MSRAALSAPPPDNPLEGLVLAADVLRSLRISDPTLTAWVRAGTFPRPVRIGRRRYWRASQLAAYLEAQSRGGPTDAA